MIKKLPLDHILAQGSRYAFSARLRQLLGHPSIFLGYSLDQSGILMPLLAKQLSDSNEQLHLVDGFKRYEWACQKGAAEIEVKVLLPDFPDIQLALYLAYEHSGFISLTAAAKALFISFCSGLGLEKAAILEALLPAIGLSPHKSVLEKYLRIGVLPSEVLLFCHEKSLSFKRCLNLSYYDRELLLWVIGQRGRLHLTASICEELLDSLNEIMRRQGLSFHDLVAMQDIREILEDETLSASQKTTRFRAMLRHLRQPTLSRINGELDNWRGRVERGNKRLSISWDKSLEHDYVEIRARVTDLAQLQGVIEQLQASDSLFAISKMLERLKT